MNKPKVPVATYNRDGTVPFGMTSNPDAYYEPNSFNGPVEDPSVAEPPHRYSGVVDRYEYRGEADHYSQPRALFALFDEAHRQRLFSTIAGAMQGVPEFIVERQLGHFDKVDPAYGSGIRAKMKGHGKDDAQASLTNSHAVAAE